MGEATRILSAIESGDPTAVEELEDRRLLSGSPSPTALTPAEVRNYYGFDKIQFTYYTVFQSRFGPFFDRVTAPGDGTGQMIAIIDKYYDPNIQKRRQRLRHPIQSSGPQSHYRQAFLGHDDRPHG
jgi:hypothetical protein